MNKKNVNLLLMLLIMSIITISSCKKEDEKVETTPPIDETSGTYTDTRDNNSYKWKLIGNQKWMIENFKYAPNTGNYISYNNDNSNKDIYGYLYDWNTAKSICPSGWHLPTDIEWQELIDFLGGDSIAGGKLKETGLTHWISPNEGANNESGFLSLPGGYYFGSAFDELGLTAFYWSNTEKDNINSWGFYISYDTTKVTKFYERKEMYYSVRYIKD